MPVSFLPPVLHLLLVVFRYFLQCPMGGTFHAPLGQALTDLSGVAGSLLIYVGWIMRWVQPQGLQAKRAVEDCDIHYSGASFLLKQLLLNPLVGSKQKNSVLCSVCQI